MYYSSLYPHLTVHDPESLEGRDHIDLHGRGFTSSHSVCCAEEVRSLSEQLYV